MFGCGGLVTHVCARGAAQRNDIFSLKGTKGSLGAMMGDPEQGSPIIACGLCHLLLTLYALSLNAQTSVSSLDQRNECSL